MLASNPADAINQLTGILNATNAMTAWAGTLVNSELPTMSPEPSWYVDVNAKLAANQQVAQQWLSTTSVKIVADMTTAFDTYAGNFKNVVQDVTPVLKTIQQSQKSLPTAAQVSQLAGLFDSMQQETAKNCVMVKTHLTDLATFRDDMQKSSADLKAALAAALPVEEKALAAVQQVQTQIQSLEITLAAETQSATDDGVNTESGIVSMVVGLTFAMGFDPVAFGVALLGIGVDIIVEAKQEQRVISDLKQIQTLKNDLSEDQMQLALMQGIVSNVERLEGGIESALATFDDFDDTWTFANYGLQYLSVVLSQPKIDISKIPDLNDLEDALVAWNTVQAYARKVQSTVVNPLPKKVISAGS